MPVITADGNSLVYQADCSSTPDNSSSSESAVQLLDRGSDATQLEAIVLANMRRGDEGRRPLRGRGASSMARAPSSSPGSTCV